MIDFSSRRSFGLQGDDKAEGGDNKDKKENLVIRNAAVWFYRRNRKMSLIRKWKPEGKWLKSLKGLNDEKAAITIKAHAQTDRILVGWLLTLIFAEAIGLYGLIVAIIMLFWVMWNVTETKWINMKDYVWYCYHLGLG